MPPAVRAFELHNSFDVVQARQCAREMAREIGFGLTDQTRFATAVSEITRRILERGHSGRVRFAVVSNSLRRGLECTCLANAQLQALQEPTHLGILGGVERLVDDFSLNTGEGEEVAVVLRKWLPQQTGNGALARYGPARSCA